MRRQDRHRLAQPRHRHSPRLRRVLFRHHAILDHPGQHAVARGMGSLRITVEPTAFRRLWQRDQHCCFRKRKPFRLLAEIGDRSGADAFEVATERRQRQIEIEDLVLAQLPFELNRAHHLPQLCIHRALAPRLHQPRQLHRNRRAAGDDVATRDELQRRAPECQRIDAAMRPETAVFICQQQFEITGIDCGFRIDRQPPAAVGHRIGAQQLVVAVDNRGGNFSRLFQRQRPERDDPGREGGGDYDEHEGQRHRDPKKAAAPTATAFAVMAGLGPAIHVFLANLLVQFVAHFAGRTSTVPVPERP
jgi:hypothetical protein